MNRSLTPLIVSFAIIILLTIIMLHTRPHRPAEDEMPVIDLAPAMRLSPFPGRRMPTAASPSMVPASTPRRSSDPNVDDLLDSSRRMLAEGKEAEAEDRLRTLLVFSPDHVPALSLLGGILYYSRRYEEAEAVYRRQLRMDPASAALHNNLASVLARQERYIEAIASAEKALEIDPASAPAHINLASIYTALGEPEQALGHFRRVYELLDWRILPVAEDSAFRELRNEPAFTMILAQARKDWEAARTGEAAGEAPAEPAEPAQQPAPAPAVP
jgi:tetratricopeptide (TPR) repeat protein